MSTQLATPTVAPAATPRDVATARTLFLEYARSLGFSLCFQGFDAELAGLPGAYAPPAGRLLLARVDRRVAGCIALRPTNEAGVCEMKRLYVRPAFRGYGVGRALAERLLDEARAIGYTRMRLDTTPAMQTAQRLYEALGFRDVEPYYPNPLPGVRYMALAL
ncbi:MAG TPA: GNAT family N-acetyltransferase [Rubricoccaceae bacterium]|nr:GNAT family N-acetyltransferase [Rubricoccaceae bacterium]